MTASSFEQNSLSYSSEKNLFRYSSESYNISFYSSEVTRNKKNNIVIIPIKSHNHVAFFAIGIFLVVTGSAIGGSLRSPLGFVIMGGVDALGLLSCLHSWCLYKSLSRKAQASLQGDKPNLSKIELLPSSSTNISKAMVNKATVNPDTPIPPTYLVKIMIIDHAATPSHLKIRGCKEIEVEVNSGDTITGALRECRNYCNLRNLTTDTLTINHFHFLNTQSHSLNYFAPLHDLPTDSSGKKELRVFIAPEDYTETSHSASSAASGGSSSSGNSDVSNSSPVTTSSSAPSSTCKVIISINSAPEHLFPGSPIEVDVSTEANIQDILLKCVDVCNKKLSKHKLTIRNMRIFKGLYVDKVSTLAQNATGDRLLNTYII